MNWDLDVDVAGLVTSLDSFPNVIQCACVQFYLVPFCHQSASDCFIWKHSKNIFD